MAAGKLELTIQQMQSAISELKEKNGQFQTKVGELENLQQELQSQWTGDANTAFNTAFQNDKQNWDTFHQLVEAYIAQLEAIQKNYEAMEATNKATATTRTFG